MLTRKDVIITTWPDQDDNDHVLIITIDMDSQMDERSGRAFVLDPSRNHEALDLDLSCGWTVAVI
jgi:hypothetical protein